MDWWKQDLGPPMPKKPWWKCHLKGTPRGNPLLSDPTYEPAIQGRKKAPFVPGDPRINIGAVVHESNRSIRRALVKLMNEGPDDTRESQSKADKIARRLYDLAYSNDEKVALAAMKELTDRVDGRAQPSKEEVDAIAAGGQKIVMIDARLRPQEPATYIDVSPRPLLDPPDEVEDDPDA